MVTEELKRLAVIGRLNLEEGSYLFADAETIGRERIPGLVEAGFIIPKRESVGDFYQITEAVDRLVDPEPVDLSAAWDRQFRLAEATTHAPMVHTGYPCDDPLSLPTGQLRALYLDQGLYQWYITHRLAEGMNVFGPYSRAEALDRKAGRRSRSLAVSSPSLKSHVFARVLAEKVEPVGVTPEE